MLDTSYDSALWTVLAAFGIIILYGVMNWILKGYRNMRARNVVTTADFKAYAEAADAAHRFVEEAPRKVASK